MVHGVIFDMDGLMFDTERLWDTLWAPACRRLGLAPPADPAFYAQGRGLAGADTLRHIERYIPGCDAPALLAQVQRDAAAVFARGVPRKPGLAELLGFLSQRGTPCAVASSSPRAIVERNLQNTDTAHFFAAIVCGADVRRSKPDPEIFLTAARRLGVPAGECLVLEDSHNGIRAGHAAGAVTVMVPDLMPVTDEMRRLYTACCKDLFEVKALLEAGRL